MKKINFLRVGFALAIFFNIFGIADAEVLNTMPTVAPVVITHTLSLGSSGSEVVLLQNFLKGLQYFTYQSATGYFGPFTKTAVIAFQKANGIDPVGIVGPITRQKILALTSHVSTNITASTTASISIIKLLKPRSGIIIANNVDRTAPSIPTGLSSSSVTQTTLSLSWTASTDTGGSGLSHYLLERCEGDECTSFEQIATPSSASFDDSDLTADTTYRYQVRAVDVAGNISGYSSILDVTTEPIPTYSLAVVRSGTGSGAVTSSPAGISCGSSCTSTFVSGSMVTLTASASVGSTFSGWSGGGCSGTGTCTVTMSSATTVTASFSLNTYALNVIVISSSGSTVTSTPAGINCGATCTSSFNFGTMVTLTATPSLGSSFVGWSGGGCVGTGTCTVTITSATSVTATFIDPA